VTGVEGAFLEHRDRLFRYLCRAVGHAETARDLTQDVFVRAAQSPRPAPPGHEARAWLFTIARNLALDHHRRQRSAAGTSVVAASGPTQEVAAAVNEALGALADLDRDVFLMREAGGLGYVDIARVCALTPEAVRSRLHRARLELRRRLAGPISTRRVAPLSVKHQRGDHE
jgi:RNA polymerase sigma-70 factor (ECF subfamily)